MYEGGLEEPQMPDEREIFDVAYRKQERHCPPSISPPGHIFCGCLYEDAQSVGTHCGLYG